MVLEAGWPYPKILNGLAEAAAQLLADWRQPPPVPPGRRPRRYPLDRPPWPLPAPPLVEVDLDVLVWAFDVAPRGYRPVESEADRHEKQRVIDALRNCCAAAVAAGDLVIRDARIRLARGA